MTPTQSNTKVSVGLRVTANGTEIINIESSFVTDNNPYVLAEHALNAACGDVVSPTTGWFASDEAISKWDIPGTGKATLSLVFHGTDRDAPLPGNSFNVDVDTTGTLRRALVQAVNTVSDYASKWNMQQKRIAAGMPA